jgi:hypothetical protein
MAEIFLCSCKCGFRSEQIEGFLESDFEESNALAPKFSDRLKAAKRNLADEPAVLAGFDKDPTFGNDPVQMTVRERLYFWFHRSRRLPLKFKRRVGKFLLPYERRTKCEGCGKMTLCWYLVGYADCVLVLVVFLHL